MKRVVAITGVAGGIGRGTARVFYEAGWVVVGIDRKKADDVHDVHRFIHADISDTDAASASGRPAARITRFKPLAGTWSNGL